MSRSGLMLWLTLSMGLSVLVGGEYLGCTESRDVLSLHGIWSCYCEGKTEPLAYAEQGGLQKLSEVKKIAVPGSLLDFMDQMDITKCSRAVWYEKGFFVPKTWREDRRTWLRLDGVSAGTHVWINRQHIISFKNESYTPIELNVTNHLFYGSENLIALAVDRESVGFPGIPQSVMFHTVPAKLFIRNVSVKTTITNTSADIKYKIFTDGLFQTDWFRISVEALDKESVLVARNVSYSLEGSLTIPNCTLWWPMGMKPPAGYLYTLVFTLCNCLVRDVYRQKVGIRGLSWTENSFIINEKALYLQGAESKVRTTFNPRIDLKDITLLDWLNANTLAMKLPPSEEMLNLADELGLCVILGSPQSALEDFIIQFGNHPSVILWSVVLGEDFNSTTLDGWRSLDPTRPFTSLVPLTIDNSSLINKFDMISLSLEDVLSDDYLLTNSSKFIQDTMKQFQKPTIVMYGDKLQSTSHKIRTLNYDPSSKISELQRYLADPDSNLTIVGEFFGNLVASESCRGTLDSYAFTLDDGIFDRNHEPTVFADFIRAKFKNCKPCRRRIPRCKYLNNHQRTCRPC